MTTKPQYCHDKARLLGLVLALTLTFPTFRTHQLHLAASKYVKTRVGVCVCSEMLEALQDKERRAQQRLDRCTEERERKMGEQRKKEQKRRVAAEQKRCQQQEAEKVRGHTHADDACLRETRRPLTLKLHVRTFFSSLVLNREHTSTQILN